MTKSQKNQNDVKAIEWLARAVREATKSALFCVAGEIPDVDPGLDVDGLGTIKLPFARGMAKKLIACCRTAPFGKGERTLVDTTVRKTFELDPDGFRLSDAWETAITDATQAVAVQLGLPESRLEARLYKLLLYEKGGFFVPHRDSEKHNGMVASLIVVLPNPFEGGTLVVTHNSDRETLTFQEAAAGKTSCYAAFYADCEHEVQRVAGGVRLCLAYNLVLTPKRRKSPAPAASSTSIDLLAESLRCWITKQRSKPLVFALEHQYTTHGRSLDLLKGADRRLADHVVAAAERADCLVHLAQVSRHLLQFADDGSFEDDFYRRRRSTRRHELEIGETYEDTLAGTEWADIAGAKQSWGAISFDRSAIVSSIPLDDWEPTSQEFEGYTGNAGNTVDRWYHRSALVVWHRDHHFEVLAECGPAHSLPLLHSMTKKLAKTPRKRLEGARNDCIGFARAIIARWPRRSVRLGQASTQDGPPYDDFPADLLALRDRDAIGQFLTTLAERDEAMGLEAFILSACREFGWSAFSQELKLLITFQPVKHARDEMALRDVAWLSALCCDSTADPDKSALGRDLCALAVERFCKPQPMNFSRRYPGEDSVSEDSLPLLLRALAACGLDQGLSRVLRFVEESPDAFSLDDCQVPALRSLIPWSRRQLGSIPPPLAAWLASVRKRLEAATAQKPVPPADWTRPATVTCKCGVCTQLRAFLADPASAVGQIPAREDARAHLIDMIRRYQCDVKHALKRSGSPYSLILTKTTGSFDRALKRFEADCRLLSELQNLPKE
jgi:hypothetical protein